MSYAEAPRWQVRDKFAVYTVSDKPLMVALTGLPWIPPRSAAAHARMIASLPVLLEALDTIAMGNTDADSMVRIARDALQTAI